MGIGLGIIADIAWESTSAKDAQTSREMKTIECYFKAKKVKLSTFIQYPTILK